jgi:predicted permease
MLTILNVILPVFLLIALGAALRASRFLSEAVFAGMNKLAFYVCLPAFLITEVARTSFKLSDAMDLFLVLLFVMLATIAIGYAVAFAIRLGEPARGAFVQAAFRANQAYVGWPIVAFAAAGLAPVEKSHVQAVMVLAVAPLIVLYNVASVFILAPAAGRTGAAPKRTLAMARAVLTNPLLLACVAGLAVNAAGWRFPTLLDRTLDGLAKPAIPMALLCVGAALRLDRMNSHWKIALTAAVLRVAVGPLLAFAGATLLGVGAIDRYVGMLFMACPTAVAAYVMAVEMGSDDELAASSVALSTLLAFPALAAVLAAGVY